MIVECKRRAGEEAARDVAGGHRRPRRRLVQAERDRHAAMRPAGKKNSLRDDGVSAATSARTSSSASKTMEKARHVVFGHGVSRKSSLDAAHNLCKHTNEPLSVLLEGGDAE